MESDYHAEIGFPDVDVPSGKYDLKPTQHAKDESKSDEHGNFNLPSEIRLTKEMYERDPHEAVASQEGEKTLPHVFEITTFKDQIIKVGVRMHYDSERDLVLVIKLGNSIVKTAWTIRKDNTHEDLNHSRYAKP